MMTRSHCYCFITIFFTLLLHTLASPPHHFCKPDQRDALLEFIAEFPTGESYTWNKSSDCCFWEGVTCNHRSGQVISLDLSYTFLNSSLKTNNSLFRLRSLRHLNLMDCNLGGEIPSSLGNLSRLLELDLWDNHLVGEVPVSVGNLNELRVLSLGGNKLSGNFPIIFANLTKLSFFGLNFNNFTSTLPVNMSEFINLEYFNINENSFFGPFPKSLFLNPLLESVDLGRNQFTGPFEFPNTSSLLQFLNLANNRFDGPIPESISKFLHLSQIYLNHNNFSGSIPRSISKLANLTDLHLSNNMLKGRVPGFLWRLIAVTLSHNYFSSFANPSKDPLIQMLDLSSNSFQGPFPHWICKLKKLSLLDLSNNLFNGSIPLSLRNSTVSLIDLILRNNSFSGIIPDIFADATELQSFDVSRNHLEGSFPKSLIICKALQIVNVENNKIKDEFPFWLGSLPSLNVLILRSNEFYGPLYHPHMSIGFQSLKVIDVSHNEFTGTLPSHYFSNWREMTTSSEEIDQYYLPALVIQHLELRLLNLSNNKSRNDIPRCMSNLKNLETLDLSSNKLSGQIPQDLGNLSFLSYMNFSHNFLEGPVPRGTQFQRQTCSSFLDNPGLFGLEGICQESHVPNPTSHQSEELSEAEEQVFSWIAAAIAYGPEIAVKFRKVICLPPTGISLNILPWILWAIWTSRNTLLFEGRYLSPEETASKGLKLSQEWSQSQGKIPSPLGHDSRLETLGLIINHLVGEVPASIGHLTELRIVSLGKNSLSGRFSSLFANLTKLTHIFLHSNNFTSTLPSDMSGLHRLEWFDISENSFSGPFPKSLFTISSLLIVYLGRNQFTGPIDFENTSSPLVKLDLSQNSFSGPIPRFISNLTKLDHLNFGKNKLEGEVPACLWNRRPSTVVLSHNYFSSFENVSQETETDHMDRLDLNSNSFRGPFPHWLCKFSRLEYLDLSNNLFSGSIPPCLKNFTATLIELTLGNNNFSGSLPDIFAGATRFKDKFPHWLGSLPSLHVLSLRFNKFFGPLYRRHHHRHMSSGFKSLRVVDISHNNFTGTLPPRYFSSWHGMTKMREKDDVPYMEPTSIIYPSFPHNYESVEMVIKGVEMSFERIRQDFRAIDFSENRIHGKISESLCSLKELHILNLSGNAFTGVIPRSLAKLTKLETLDLSCNKLSGEIPQDLGKLSFLSYMNFSHNDLQGSVPRGTQFQSQNCSSFMDNPELLGLEDICRKPNVLGPTSHQPEEVSESEEPMFNWVAAAIAYGPGVLCGLVIGHIFTSHNHEWFAEKFGLRKLRVTRRDH
ncbi:hypothetical protein DY000_02063627 [Brassica cretica]|uniref:Leucine-rich repeat-containing N-terminal plant-type domain-containing protein n=1 Tax=Brassica cretica TaxID=69181 RepID=A0ABQ7ATD2_BRACR|nr:hypothetical protein DY000_02063627 [Brassica cretica]